MSNNTNGLDPDGEDFDSPEQVNSSDHPWAFLPGEEARELDPGMGLAVARRTVFREADREDWRRVAKRVALGNTLLTPTWPSERRALASAIARGALLTSGRHLQHGDRNQLNRPMEVVTNCASAATSFLKFYLLLNGCFRAGTKIRMGDGTQKPIEKIKEGEFVQSYSESSAKFEPQIVERTFVNPPKPMVKLTLENGETIVCTEDHLFLAASGKWIQAKDLEGVAISKKPHGHEGTKKPPEQVQSLAQEI